MSGEKIYIEKTIKPSKINGFGNLTIAYTEISIKEIVKIMNITTGKVRYYIEIMKKAGTLEHIGSTKKGKWIVHK